MSNNTIVDICVAQQASISTSINFTYNNLSALIPLLYGIPSIILSVFIIKLLLGNRTQKDLASTFYLIFSINGIIEMSEWIVYNYVQRFPSAPWLGFIYVWIPKDGIVVSVLYFLVSYLGYLNHIPSLLLTINRLTSVLYPLKHDKIWKKILKPIYLIYFLYPLIFSWQFLIMNQVRHCQIWDITHSQTYHMFTTQLPIYGVELHIGVTIVAFVISISCLIINTVTMILLISHRKHRQPKNHAERKNARMELKLFILTMLMFINEFTVGIMMLISYFVAPTSQIRRFILTIQPFVVDLICLTPPWMLIITSRKVRSKLFGRVWKKFQATSIMPANHA